MLTRILPIRPFPPTNNNGGIVPPWLQERSNGNTGIVPPWMQSPIGINPPVAPTDPVGPDVPRILPIGGPTVFDPTPVDPEQPRILPVG